MEDCITICAILPMLFSVCMWKNGTYFLRSCCHSIKAHFLNELLKDSNHTILDKITFSKLVPNGLSMFTRICAIVGSQGGSLIFLLFLHMKVHS